MTNGAQAWQDKDVLDVSRGMDLSKPPFKLADGQFVRLRNVVLKDDEIIIDTGYRKFGALLTGVPRITYQFFKTDGTSELILITDTTFYKWVSASAQWQYVKGTFSTTVNGNQPAGETVIEVTATTGFSIGDRVGIALDNGSQHQSVINAISAGVSITIDDAIPVGRQANTGAAVVRAVALAGSVDIQVSVTTMANNNFMIFTNGVDAPKRYDGTDAIDVPNLPSGGNFRARVVLVFENHLVFYHTTEGGTAFPQRVRRSDTGNPSEWTLGNAGFDDLEDTEDFILAAAPLGNAIIIYRERSINRMTFVGTADRLFFFDTAITGEGVLSADSVVDLGDIHILFGATNFYEYDGGFSLSPIGDPIFNLIFGAGGELNPGASNKVFGVYVEELDDAVFFYPAGASLFPNRAVRYKVGKRAWAERTLSHDIVGFGFYQKESSPTWNELVGTWLDQTFTWNSKLLEANAPTLQLCGKGPDQVYEYDFVAPDDDGIAIQYEIESPDFLNTSGKSRIDRLRSNIRGSAVQIEFSADEGLSFDLVETVSPGALYSKVNTYKQTIVDNVRFRWKGSGGGFGLRWFSVRHKDESRL